MKFVKDLLLGAEVAMLAGIDRRSTSD
jgi:hypothetical protein